MTAPPFLENFFSQSALVSSLISSCLCSLLLEEVQTEGCNEV